MAASVEDFPDPVGPVTSTMPLRRLEICGQFSGQIQGFEIVTFTRNHAHHNGAGSALHKNVYPKTRRAGQTVRNVARSIFLQVGLRMLVVANQVARDALRVDRSELEISYRVRRPFTSTMGGLPGEKNRSLIFADTFNMAVSMARVEKFGVGASATAAPDASGEVVVEDMVFPVGLNGSIKPSAMEMPKDQCRKLGQGIINSL